jgi:TonB family protein
MTHRARPARHFLRLGLSALALLFAAPLVPRLAASRTAAPSAQTPADVPAVGDPVNKEWLLYALREGRVGEAEIIRQVEGRSSSFFPTAEDEKELRAAGATDRLLEAVRKSFRQGPQTVVGAPPGGGGPGGGGGISVVDYTRAFRTNEVTKRALITHKPEPGFTEEARQNGAEGVVRLRAVLTADGKVAQLSVVKGLPDGLTEKAIAAAKQIRFTPAEKDGRAVSQHAVLEYYFTIHVDEDKVEKRAVIIERPPAEYTDEARRNNVRGKVVLKVTLTSYGTVMIYSVEKELPHGLTRKAIEAALRIKFKPALMEGRAVSQITTVEYTFGP